MKEMMIVMIMMITREERISKNEIQMIIIMIRNNIKLKGNTSNHLHLHPHHLIQMILMIHIMENNQEEVLSQGKRLR